MDRSSVRRGRAASEYRGAPAEWTLRLVLNSRSPQFEVIQPLDGPSVHADRLEERGEGFHQVGYVVRSLEQTTAELKSPEAAY